MTYKRACLIVIDGWGSRDESHGNAIMEAETPVMDAFKEDSDHYGIIGAAGLYVGLPDGTMGNSEVGHLTIGAGAVDYQDLVKINKSISEKTLSTRPALVDACKAANAGTGRLHLWGLLSDGGVHSHNQHIYALIEAIKGEGVKELFLHCCMDGRDTAPTSGGGYMKELEDKLAELNYGKVASVMGRYYAMDRDKRWERVQKAYDVMCRASGGEAKWAGEYDKEVKAYDVEAGKVKDLIEAMHGQKMTDEFIEPTGVCPGGGIADGDVFVCFNFRADRAKEMFECIAVKPLFDSAVERKPGMTISMTKLSAQFADLGIPTIFPPGSSSNGLSETVSKLGLTQYHSAETEKFAHVTFFFNGGREAPFEGEVRQLEDSPKVATYDLAPKMTVEKVANNMVAEIEAGKHTFLVCNLAAPDMVGHTGIYEKAMIAAAHTDECIGKIAAACKEKGVGLFITADHGNCETMLTEEGKPMTSHSCTPVPFVCQTGEKKVKRSVADRKDAGVADIAPTMLTYMGIPVPKEMTGESWID